MVTVSLCMIVKDEEDKLATCLDCVKDLVDEMIIVDTGSSDKTVEIAESYGAKVFKFAWTGDFSDARNFSFKQATCEYIYAADADETIDEENRERFKQLKEDIDDLDIDVVQMYYCNQLSHNTVYNYDRELRPKLFRRVRSFIWQDPIHETIQLDPVVCNSEVEIQHNPTEDHGQRDLAAFRRAVDMGSYISKRLHNLYARELYMVGGDEDFILAKKFFSDSIIDTGRDLDQIKEASCVLTHIAVLEDDVLGVLKYSLKDVTTIASSEMCYELGEFYRKRGDIDEAIVWYFNAAYETSPILDIHHGGDLPMQKLAECYRELGNLEQAEDYEKEAARWEPPKPE
ncbi:glycosyltransferase [Butyrivibrio sp. WCD3002]|uniref:glycosyltransferase n=1 Tax=Butyrivibrio sp. WCD3002 TaxID=1280676 RepID=UPI0004017986|nr:glycosyltransferase [Butyrivibrio sp. WCD3002]